MPKEQEQPSEFIVSVLDWFDKQNVGAHFSTSLQQWIWPKQCAWNTDLAKVLYIELGLGKNEGEDK